MSADLMNQGLELMLVGMGTVFIFLTLLVLATTLMSRLVMRYQPEPVRSPVSDAVTVEEVAAITAAIATHRRRQPDDSA